MQNPSTALPSATPMMGIASSRAGACGDAPVWLNPSYAARAGSRWRQHLGADVGDAARAGERHGDVELVLEDLDRPRDAGLAAGAQAIQEGAADHAGAGAERER